MFSVTCEHSFFNMQRKNEKKLVEVWVGQYLMIFCLVHFNFNINRHISNNMLTFGVGLPTGYSTKTKKICLK